MFGRASKLGKVKVLEMLGVVGYACKELEALEGLSEQREYNFKVSYLIPWAHGLLLKPRGQLRLV